MHHCIYPKPYTLLMVKLRMHPNELGSGFIRLFPG